VESGVNDGFALPIVLFLIALVTGRNPDMSTLAIELAAGVALGVVLPWLACRLEQSRFFGVAKPYEPLFAVAIGLLVLTIASLTGANLFLASFAAGVTLATVRSDLRDEFHRFGELITELLKLAALLVFGALISPAFLAEVHWSGYVAAFLILLAARPIAIEISLLGSNLDWRERLTAGWFGPKGFASAIYGLLLFTFGVPNSEQLFHFTAVVIVASILAHSSSDVPIARWFRGCQQRKLTAPDEDPTGATGATDR
jgi:NhaP-type Na+/H+ or K+/H+ antiporter